MQDNVPSSMPGMSYAIDDDDDDDDDDYDNNDVDNNKIFVLLLW